MNLELSALALFFELRVVRLLPQLYLDLSEFSSYKTEEVENIYSYKIHQWIKKTEKLYGICITSKIHEILKEKY